MFPILYSDDFLRHDTGLGHPECAARLIAIKTALERSQFAHQLEWRSPTVMDDRNMTHILLKVHSVEYLERVRISAASGVSEFESTPVCHASETVARLAVMAWLDGLDCVMDSDRPAFILARPPGHHALPNEGMGFCLFANAAIAAIEAVQRFGLERVAILDWDVHHGNGTQAIVENHRQIHYCSLHQSPAYPMTGKASEKGHFDNILNIPLKPGSGAAVYDEAFQLQVLPWLRSVSPELLIVSAGYDAMDVDPLARMNLKAADYGRFTEWCLEVTPRILFGLEGGYDLAGLSGGVMATVEACFKREEGRGKREEGRGKREERREKRGRRINGFLAMRLLRL
jgi:acetoin utilization deacetylase AcuC-like enzyme